VRLAVVTSGFPRRSETFALNELLALQRAGVLAGVFATKDGDAGPAQPGAERLRVSVLAPGTAAEQGREVAARLRGAGVTAVHGYFAHAPAAVARAAAERLAVPFGFSVHARDARKVSPDALRGRARAAACVIACNADAAGEIERGGGGEARLVPHGVDLDRFPACPTRAARPLVLLAVGRLVEKKGFGVLVDAAARLDVPFRLRIVGDGPERARLDRPHVELAGAVTHARLPAEYAAADVVVVPSVEDASGDRDGLPNVVLEAMASARAVVASNVGAVATAVRDGETGLLVPPGDADALARAIRRLAGDTTLRARLGRDARAAVEREFELGRCTDRLRATLEAAYG
jgi:glycosyltransferase involved in cell wall biosynthesis